MTRWKAVAAASGLLACAIFTFPATAHAATPSLKIPIPGLPSIQIPVTNPLCEARQDPPVRTPGQGLSGVFDGTPAVPAGTGASVYDNYGAHPFSWYVWDPGCLGQASNPPAMIDTWIGNEELGAAQDLTAMATGLHRLATDPTWLHTFDTLETDLVTVIATNIWLVFLPISLVLIGLLILVRKSSGNLAATVKIVVWTLLVMGVVTAVWHEPVKAGRAADQAETSLVNTVPAALAGQQAASTSAFGSEEIQYVIEPMWLRGEVGTSTGPVAEQYGSRLLGDTALTWAETAADENGANTRLKQKDFEAVAAKISTEFPSAYPALKGTAEDRVGTGFMAAFGAVMTAPFQMVADLLVIASLLILRLAVVMLPLLAVIGIHYQFRSVLILVGGMVAAALINAVIFSCAAAVNVFIVGYLLTSTAIPVFVALIVAGLFAVLAWRLLKPVRKLTSMVSAADVSRGLTSSVEDLRRTVRNTSTTAAKVGVAGATGGASAAATVAAGGSLAASKRSPVPEAQGDRPGRTWTPTGTAPAGPAAPVVRPVPVWPGPAQANRPTWEDPWQTGGEAPSPKVSRPVPEADPDWWNGHEQPELQETA